MQVVICGGGVIGTSCAYYLARQNISCIIIEEDDIACAASGRAGGFLAKTWCASNVCNDLAKLSYKLHLQLANVFKDVDYRNVNTYSASLDPMHCVVRTNVPSELSWVDGPISKCSLLESKDNTCQVHPRKLCKKFLDEAKKLTNNGTRVIHGTVVGLDYDHSGAIPVIKSVKLRSGESIEADKVIIAMGPWSYKAMDWFPQGSIPRINGHRAHSIILKAPKTVEIPADCLFLQYQTSRGITSPELYPRPDGTVYVSGLGDEAELPNCASEVSIERWRCSQLRDIAYSTCSNLECSEILAEQACFLPLSPDGVPVIGKIDTVEGAYVATGHSCWGILNSTGTGYAIAELIATGKCQSVDLKPFRPGRFK